MVGAINWIHVAQDGDKCLGLLIKETRVWVPQMPGIS